VPARTEGGEPSNISALGGTPLHHAGMVPFPRCEGKEETNTATVACLSEATYGVPRGQDSPDIA
jgi:hypothetical protein